MCISPFNLFFFLSFSFSLQQQAMGTSVVTCSVTRLATHMTHAFTSFVFASRQGQGQSAVAELLAGVVSPSLVTLANCTVDAKIISDCVLSLCSPERSRLD